MDLQKIPIEQYLDLQTKLVNYVDTRMDMSQLPNVRGAAQALKLTHKNVLELAEDTPTVAVNIGIACRAGVHEFTAKGDYTLEVYDVRF